MDLHQQLVALIERETGGQIVRGTVLGDPKHPAHSAYVRLPDGTDLGRASTAAPYCPSPEFSLICPDEPSATLSLFQALVWPTSPLPETQRSRMRATWFDLLLARR